MKETSNLPLVNIKLLCSKCFLLSFPMQTWPNSTACSRTLRKNQLCRCRVCVVKKMMVTSKPDRATNPLHPTPKRQVFFTEQLLLYDFFSLFSNLSLYTYCEYDVVFLSAIKIVLKFKKHHYLSFVI